MQTLYVYSARLLSPIFSIFSMHIARVTKNNHAKLKDQQIKEVDASEPKSWSKSQKTRFLVIFAIFDDFERSRMSASFIILTSYLAYYTS